MTGDVFISIVPGVWKDAFTEWGVNLEDGALSALMTPPPMKEFIESKSRLLHGKSVITKAPRYDSRDITLPFHIVARSRNEFFLKYNKFCDDVLSNGSFSLKTKYQPAISMTVDGSPVAIPEVVYHLVYLSCTQFSQFQQQLAKFTLKVCEPNPADRTESVTI